MALVVAIDVRRIDGVANSCGNLRPATCASTLAYLAAAMAGAMVAMLLVMALLGGPG